jgi:hypothetical protein
MHSSNPSTSAPAPTENSNTCCASSQGESVPQGRVCLSSCALVRFARRHLIPEWRAEAQWGGGVASNRGASSEGVSSGSDLASCLNGRQVAQLQGEMRKARAGRQGRRESRRWREQRVEAQWGGGGASARGAGSEGIHLPDVYTQCKSVS